MDIKVFFIAFAAFAALLTLTVILRKGFDRLDAWIKANPFQSALAIAAVIAVVLAVFVANSPALTECFSSGKLVTCFLPHKP